MKSDIKIMIELQRYWQNVLKGKEDTERERKKITFWKDELKKKQDEEAALLQGIKELRHEIKTREVDLEEVDGRIKKLEERRPLLKSEKELDALGQELEKAKGEDEALEESLIISMDDLDAREKEEAALKAELEEMAVQVAKDITFLEGKISEHEAYIAENNDKYESLLPSLSSTLQKRFPKLLKSKNGRAISPVRGDVCGSCNFQIPPHLVQETAGNSTVVTCTNCGCYIFEEF